MVCSKNLANSRLGTGSLRTGCVCSRAAHTEGQVSGHTCTYDPSRCVRPSIPKSTSLSDSSNACFLHFDNIPSWLEKVCFWQHGSLPFHEGERRVSCLPSYLLWEGDLLFDKFGQISCFSSFSKVLLLLEPNVCIIIVLLVLYTAIATFSIQIVT